MSQKLTQKSHYNIYRLVALAFVLIPAFNNSTASATDIPMSVSVAETLTISLSNTDGSTYDGNVALRLDPDANSLSQKGLDITVGTNHAAGYTMTVTSANDATSLTDSNTSYTFPTLESSVTDVSNFPSNYWGYKSKVGTASESNYLPFESGTVLDQTDSRSNEKTTTFTFGAKANYQAKPGNYALAVTFNAVANPTGPSSISELTYMQDFADLDPSQKATILGTMTEGEAYQIKDNRDEEEYKIAKLADGNVWLLDNLRLDLTSVTLAKLQGNTNADDTTLSYLKTDTSSAPSPYTKYAVSNSWTSSSQNYYDRPMINTSYKDTPTTGYGSGSKTIGVYYNYCAATAGSYCYASGSGTGNASQDICPKGWSLPTGGTDTTANFHALCKAYNNNTACSSSQSMTATATTSLQYNLSTPLSGYFLSGSPYGQGSYGLFWSSTRYDGSYMYTLRVYSSTVDPQNGSNRRNGLSVRCLLQ